MSKTTSRRTSAAQRPASGASRALAVKNASVGTAAYETGSQTRRTIGWKPSSVGPNNALLPTLTTMRDRSRHAVRNDGIAKGISDKFVSNLIGTGIQPLSLADDPEFRRAVGPKWLRWTDESDADGLLDFYGQQAQAARGWEEGGEVFIRLRQRRPEDGLSVPLQLQILEPELCPHTYTTRLPNGNRVRAGIELNVIGKRVAYWMYPEHPGEFQDTVDATTLKAVPADTVIHLFDPLRPGQLRGAPRLAQSLVTLLEVGKVRDFTLLRGQLQNLFVAFLRRTGTAVDDAIHPLTGQTTSATQGDRPVLSLEPGIFQELGLGEDVAFSDPPDLGEGLAAFIKFELQAACAAAGVPYEVVTGDMSGLNDRVMRVILGEFRRSMQALQHHIFVFQVCRRVWRAWMDRAWLSGALPIPAAYAVNPEPWLRAKWQPQGWPYLHPVQDVEAQVAAIRAGFTTRSAVVSEQGDDSEQIDRENAADNTRADDLDLRYDSDGRQAATPKDSLAQAAEAGATAAVGA